MLESRKFWPTWKTTSKPKLEEYFTFSEKNVELIWSILTNVRKKFFFIRSCFETFTGGWVGGWVSTIENKANSVQLKLQLPTGTELGNKERNI